MDPFNAMVTELVKRRKIHSLVSAIVDLLVHIVSTVSCLKKKLKFVFDCLKIIFIPDLNDCLPNPCKNNGMCLDGDGKFTCKCAPGWSGK